MTDLDRIRKHIISTLAPRLPASLTYHNLDHTLDVETQCIVIAAEEGVTDTESLLELRIAALYHDYGFLYIRKGHEEKSCELAKTELPGFGLNETAIENICEIILATRLPQSPKNLLQKILCDADLDYLGRDDFFVLNNNFRNECIEYGMISSEKEWVGSTINFLNSHAYFTKYSQKVREPKKLLHLNYLFSVKIE